MKTKILADFQICISVSLMHKLKEKDKAIYSELHKRFFTHITKLLDSFLKIGDIRDLLQPFVEVENKLLNRRITKYLNNII